MVHIRKTTSLYTSYYKKHVVFHDNSPPRLTGVQKSSLVIKQKNQPWTQSKSSKKRKKIIAQNRPREKEIKKFNYHEPAVAPNFLKKTPDSVILRDLTQVSPSKKIDSFFLSRLVNRQTPVITLRDTVKNEPTQAKISVQQKISTGYWSKKYLSTGFGVTDVLYSNIFLEGGIKSLHLILTAGTNYKINSWGTGLGTKVDITTNALAFVNTTLSFLNNNYDDTIGNNVFKVKAKLWSVNLGWGKYFSKNSQWQVRLGVNFNQLYSKYYNRLSPISAGDFMNATGIRKEQLQLLQPVVFPLSDNFNLTRYKSTKTWVGISLGIYYDIF